MPIIWQVVGFNPTLYSISECYSCFVFGLLAATHSELAYVLDDSATLHTLFIYYRFVYSPGPLILRIYAITIAYYYY